MKLFELISSHLSAIKIEYLVRHSPPKKQRYDGLVLVEQVSLDANGR